MRVKICGITTVADALAAARYGADLIGLIRAPGPRAISVAVARDIVKALPPSVVPVMLFRDAPHTEVLADSAGAGVAHVQLHGLEGPQFIAKLHAERADLRIIKAWPIENDASAGTLTTFVGRMRDLHLPPEFIILDAPKDGPHPTFARMGRISKRALTSWPPLWLAGGLTFDNLVEAASHGTYAGIDVARGVESAPGVKDPLLLERFIAAAKRL